MNEESIFDDCSDSNCPVHTRTDELVDEEHDFAGITYLGNYCVYTDIDMSDVISDPASILARLVAPVWVTVVVEVGDGTLASSGSTFFRGSSYEPVYKSGRNSMEEAKATHARFVDTILLQGLEALK